MWRASDAITSGFGHSQLILGGHAAWVCRKGTQSSQKVIVMTLCKSLILRARLDLLILQISQKHSVC